MADETLPTLDLDQRILEIASAYESARAAGQPFDLDAVLADEPGLADAVYSRLGLAPPGPAPEGAATPGVIRATPPIGPPWAQTLSLGFGDGGGQPADSPGDFGDYELLEEIARGGMGIVFRAREKSLNRVVALKMIRAGRLASSEEVRRFRLEAEEASRLDHPNIVPIYRIGEYVGHHYFTMKLIEGGTLGGSPGGSRDIRAAARLMITVSRAVHYAHRHGILHRDIKPGNILIDHEGRPHVTDFGLVKHVGGPGSHTRSGAIVGTPGYMSPEQAAARKDLTTAADVYSLGAVLYDLITGRAPFAGGSALDTLRMVLEEEPTPPQRVNPRVDRDLQTICLTCLNKDPRRRYASADALARDLERYLAGEPILARRSSRVERAQKWVRRRPLAAALAAVLVAAGLVLAGGGWVFSAQLRSAVRVAHKAQEEAEQGEREADRKRQEVNEYLVYVNERLAAYRTDEPIRLEFLRAGLDLCERWGKATRADPETRRQHAQLYRCLGDLEADRRDPQSATDAYGRAIELLEQLAGDFPANAVYGHDLAVTFSKKAHFLETRREYAAALAALQQAIELQDRLADEPTAPPDYRQKAAEFRVTLGTFCEEQNKLDEAETAYRAALALADKLAAEPTAPPSAQQQVASAAGTLAWLLAEGRPAETEALLQRRLRVLRTAAQAGHRESADALWTGYTDLAAFFRRHGRHAELAALANQVRGDFLGQPAQTYNAARFMTDAIRVVVRKPDLSPPQRDALTEEYAGLAVGLLDKAIKENFSDRARIEVDPDLDPLRPRKDFGALLTELERRHPSLPPEQELAALYALFDHARTQYAYQMDGARTQVERQRALAVKPYLGACADKFLALAQKWRESTVAMEALVRVLENCRADEVGPDAERIRASAAKMLQEDHLQRPEFGNVCVRFVRSAVPEADSLLKEAMARHPQREVRGRAGLAVAINLARDGNRARDADPARAESMTREAEQQLEKLLNEYGDVNVGRSPLRDVARHELDEVRYLSVGSAARDIVGEDLQGRALKLSDFRDKVVVVDFWADWCGFCRQMHPQEQDLVQRYKGRPFALLGINRDEDREAICRTIARKGLNWPSWWDGGPDGSRICDAWHVHSFPTIFVLDHKHVIRFREVRGKKLDEAVAKLVKEAEDEQSVGK